jgi:hypothetical protein
VVIRLAAILLLSALFGCGERASDPAPRREAQPVAPRPAPAPALPQPGEVRASRQGERYTLLAREVAPQAALAEFAALAGFRVEPEANALPEGALRLELRDVPVGEALRAILRGVPFDVHFEFADGDLSPERSFAGRAIVLSRVTIGGHATRADRREAPAARDPHERALAERTGEAEDREADAERARLRDEAESRERERAAAVERDWRDARAGVRLEAIGQMEPYEEDDRMRLATLLRDDPSAEVRAAAAERLAEGNPFAVTDPLLGALEDLDPQVVAHAVSSLEDVYAEAPDPRIRERVTALRQHRDAGVREAVASFEEWLDE